MFFSRFTKALVLALAIRRGASHGTDHSDDEEHSTTITWETMQSLPSPRSDLTATVAGTGSMSKIYLIGGCVADQVKAPWDPTFFYCPEITSRCDVYDPVMDKYDDCAAAPTDRYRHAAVEIDGKVWVVGGANADDSANTAVEVYDPAQDSWTTFGNWAGATTDLAAFAVGTDLYLVGGYDATDYQFTAMADVFKIDTTAEVFATTQVASLKHGRGDVFAAVADSHVYVTGGFTHVDYWCEPHDTVEKFNIATGEWSRAANMTYARGDKALVHMNDYIYAVGGETKDDCAMVNASTPVEHVEVYDIKTDSWIEETIIPEERFRFVAVGHEDTDSIFIFGGQKYYDATCDCYKIADDVIKFTDSEWIVDVIDDNGAASKAVVLGAAAVGAVAAAVFML